MSETETRVSSGQVDVDAWGARHLGFPVLSREAIRRETFAEVSRAMNRHADIWERDGSDPCRVRVERELANAYRAYAEGYGEPTGSR